MHRTTANVLVALIAVSSLFVLTACGRDSLERSSVQLPGLALVGATLLDDLGDYSRPITSEHPEVQRWFDILDVHAPTAKPDRQAGPAWSSHRASPPSGPFHRLGTRAPRGRPAHVIIQPGSTGGPAIGGDKDMPLGLGRRARSLEELGVNMGALAARPTSSHRPYAPEPGDVFITCWAKSGTTMMQQMFHQLRMVAATGASDMDFDDISRVVPWDDTATMLDFDMTASQRAAPRGFKSHREYERLPVGMRYVVTLRDPKETYVSFYRFFDGWHIERGALSLEEFFPLWMGGGPGGCNYFTHLLSWWARRDAPDTLLANYSSAAADRPAMIRRLAAFLGIEATDAVVDEVDALTSRTFMHAHLDRFDDAMVCRAMDEGLGIPADSDSTKVQAVGSDAREVPPSIAEQIDALWAERVEPVTGAVDFAALAAKIDSRG